VEEQHSEGVHTHPCHKPRWGPPLALLAQSWLGVRLRTRQYWPSIMDAGAPVERKSTTFPYVDPRSPTTPHYVGRKVHPSVSVHNGRTGDRFIDMSFYYVSESPSGSSAIRRVPWPEADSIVSCPPSRRTRSTIPASPLEV